MRVLQVCDTSRDPQSKLTAQSKTGGRLLHTDKHNTVHLV